ncbi:AraC family transcriptional regulator [Nocardia huaxiensis]|uniref:AraC family transcriptional regulator n=1 Tax=Nocardia huaxiensis TaxID=2755382 RepID=A0A7D6Z2V5_9NOCA|nr:AraC family transcriptional regulator [Nocardia huaxiensis]QLY31486.1 AraC family transcriptional regulator [Nocardia huaxiensis]UFS95037.1 AraC family transcriptional regulator [Nocardia huaxiensis]
MDVLTEALASMRTGAPSSVRTDGRAPWGMLLPEVLGAGFHVVLHGTCWIILSEKGSEPIALGPGDVIFIRDGAGHILADHPSTPATVPHPDEYTQRPPVGALSIGGDGPRTSLLCGNYHLDGARPHPLLRQLPEFIHLPARHGKHPELAAAIQLLGAELDNPRIGTSGIVPALIDSLLLYILRAWIEDQPASKSAGWAAALKDPAISPALEAMHADPAAPWTVQSLADHAGLSRAAFAKKFTTMIGEPPLAYLTRWRLTTAARLLREDDLPVAVIATRTGYTSEFAFAKAFKREYSLPPGQYRRQSRPAA